MQEEIVDMNKRVVIALDVGGTTVDGALVSSDGSFVGRVTRIESPESKSLQKIIAPLGGLIERLRNNAQRKGLKVIAVGMGFPGPTDYESGISLMKHKFRSLYGKSVKKILEDAVDLPVYLINDADAFALGVWKSEYQDERRLLAITLGTGLGAGFVMNGKIATEVDGSPPNGEIWNLPYKSGILEDAVSKRGIQRNFERLTGRRAKSVKDIADKARKGNVASKETFAQFASDLGQGLAIATARFKPTRVVLGGQISKSSDLFGESAAKIYIKKSGRRIPFSPTSTQRAPLIGAAWDAVNKFNQGP